MNTLADFNKALEDFIDLIEKHWNEINIGMSGMWANRGWDSPEGSMSAFEISYYIEGCNIININNKKHNTKKGDFYFSDLSLHSSGTDADFKMYYITFSTKNSAIYDRVSACFKILSECVQPGSIAGLEDHFAGFHSEVALARSYSSYIAKYHFINILVRFYRSINSINIHDNRKANTSKHELMVCEIINHINENFHEKISLQSLSERYSLNERYLNSVFKKITGRAIIEYLIKLRIEKAKRLLGFTSMKITDIALEIGFCDCQHFCKTFKKLEGLTPMEFRNKLF